MNTTLVTNEFMAQLTNKELAKELHTIKDAVVAGNKASWQVANSFCNITMNELFSDDYETEKEFAEDVGVSKAYLSQCKNAVLFADKYDIDKALITVGKCYKLSTLSDEEYKYFCEWCLENNLDIPSMSDKGLIEMIKTWKQGIEELEEVEDEESEESEEKVNEDEDEEGE